ncbi:speckle-type POZ protein B-like [Belonocnema kinseyi]|uniref:speckle-type POZ protein B-like n=1 Tax=Belonocnema kinseyi TaxID=2817044 RepID=UPI00143D7276|nr:speckle-type POZ protein B-like [Belonocnema kinseyi]
MEPVIQDTEELVTTYSYLTKPAYQTFRFEWTIQHFSYLSDSLHTIEKSFFPPGTDNKYKWVFEVKVQELDNEDMLHLMRDRILEFNLKTNDINKYVEYSLSLKSLSYVYNFEDLHIIANDNFVFNNSIPRNKLIDCLNWRVGGHTLRRDLTTICKLRIVDSFQDFQNEEAMLEHNETQNISDHKNSILVDDSFKDFSFIVQGTKFDVHKIILALESLVFATIFKSEMREGLSSTANIDDIDPDVFEKMIQFIYHRKIDKSDLEKSAPQFLKIAHM